MIGIEGVNGIEDKGSAENIRDIVGEIVTKVKPLKVILFGSFAKGAYTDESDYDFYLVVEDGRNVAEATRDAYRASGYIKKRPVDIVVGTNSRFERKRKASHTQMVEREVDQYGILLYDCDTMA